MDAKHLSKRLASVAAFVEDGARLADIGSDHAYLPANLVLTGRIDYAVAGEVVRGPYDNMVNEINHYGLAKYVHPRLADGLAAVHDDDRIDTVTIAGMGGSLISQILENGQDQLKTVTRMVLQANVGAVRVREWLANHGWAIRDERILEEAGHIYQIIEAGRAKQPVHYSDQALLFGPVLLKDPNNPAFVAMWQAEAKRLASSIAAMKSAKQPPVAKIADFSEQLKEIKEVLSR